MKFINSSVSLLTQNPGMLGILQQIEAAGRVSYKSEDKIESGSAEKFAGMLIKRGHLSPCEHGTVYLTIPIDDETRLLEETTQVWALANNKYTTTEMDEDNLYITTNYRVLLENKWENMLKYLTDSTEQHVKRVTFKIICSRGIGNEIVRHRALSVTQESTRYCTYTKDKFDNCITCIIPDFIDGLSVGDEYTEADIEPSKVISTILKNEQQGNALLLAATYVLAEKAYRELIQLGSSAQNARDVLPLGLKTELAVTGTIPEWQHFLSLRSPAYGAKGMHPDMGIIGDAIYKQLQDAGYLNLDSDDTDN